MARKGYSPQEQQLFQRGPFDGGIDPWSEDDHYFQTIHTEIISALIDMIQQPLFELGYVPGREASLQITEGRDDDNSQLDSLHIYEAHYGNRVTVCEIVSPANKATSEQVLAYQERRSRLFIEKGVNVVEADLTRSIKRLVHNSVTTLYPYHVAVFLPGDPVRILEIKFKQPLPRLALPLRGEVIPVELHQAYRQAYSRAATAWRIEHDGHYVEEHLPFASNLNAAQREEALARIAAWRAELARLRGT